MLTPVNEGAISCLVTLGNYVGISYRNFSALPHHVGTVSTVGFVTDEMAVGQYFESVTRY